MKRLTSLVLALVASLCSLTAWAERVAPNLPEPQTLESGNRYIMYNVGSNRFIRREGSDVLTSSTLKSVVLITNMGDGTFTIDANLYLDAYTTDRATGMDKLDFTGFDGNLSFDVPLNLVVHLDDANDFLGQVVTLDWLVGVPEEMYNIDNINLSLVNDEGISFLYWLNADGSITFGDHNAIPEPSTWALLILGALGLLYWRRKN